MLEKNFTSKKARSSSRNFARNSIREQDTVTQLKHISDNLSPTTKGTLSEQINSVVLHYQTQIKAEEFQVEVLLQQLALGK